MRNLILLLTIIFGIMSCEDFQKNEYYKLPVSKKTQLTADDTIVFTNEESMTDSFVVKNIIKGYWQLALSGTSSEEPYAFHEFEYIMINNIHDSFNSFRYKLMITQTDGYYGEGATSLETSCDSLIIGIMTGTRNIWNTTYEKAPKDYLPIIKWYNQHGFEYVHTISAMTINGKTYSDVMEFSSDSKIRRICYDYESGLLEYMDSENHTWTKK